MSEITPGPWTVVAHSWGEAGVYGADRKISGLDIRYEANEDTQDAWTARMMADARAISAVPEMMEALQKMTDAFIAEFGDGIDSREPDGSSVFAGVPDDGDGITFGLLRQARTALAKARRETP